MHTNWTRPEADFAAPPTRGIIIPSGGTVLVTNAYIVIKILREFHNCKLPIDVVYNGPKELDEQTKRVLESKWENVSVIDAQDFPYPAHHRPVAVEHFVFKTYAFYHARFDQVLVLDSDSLPLRDPEELFNSREFQRSGNLFWADFSSKFPSKAYALFGLPTPEPSAHWLRTTESGEFLFDRRVLADVAEWIWFVNSVGPSGIYKYMWGDKDTFQLAFNLAGKGDAFRQVPQYPRALLCKVPGVGDKYDHVGMLQSDMAGKPMFAHRTHVGKFRPHDKRSCYGINYISVPLSEQRGKTLHGWGVFPDGVKDIIDIRPRDSCNFTRPVYYNEECGADVESTAFPFPVFSIEDFDEPMKEVVYASYRAFWEVKALVKQGEILAHTCKTYDLGGKGNDC
ncbi:hypothetical protein WJX72_004823 [[Myrmecia] bisecta]|uniref:Uncharacterized protein n=1 Tax=[Myrmecia] bisecta TaxID=41462 RepID=A0AAW1PFQ3_9CHLO